MKVSFKSIGKKTASIAIATLLAGTGATAGVFAAIPDSTTGVIAGCRSTVGGAIRAIDAQLGATCGVLEAPISISSPSAPPDSMTALLRLKPNPSDANNYVIDATRSRNIIAVDTVADPNPENVDYRTLCIQVAFAPETSMVTVDHSVGIGGGGSLQLSLIHQSPTVPEEIEYACDSTSYNAIAYLNPYSPAASAQSIFFAK